MKISKVKTNTIIVIIIMLTSKVLAFLKDILISKNFGIGIETDAYNIVYLIIITLFGVVGSALNNSIMPMLTEIYINNRKKFEDSINSIVTLIILITVFVSIIMYIYPKLFIDIFANGINKDTFFLTANLLQLGCISLVFLALNSTINCVLRIYGYTIIPTISNIIFPLPGIFAMLFFSKNIEILTISILIGYLLQVIFQVVFLKFKKFKFKFIFKFKENGILNILKLMPPMILSSGVLQINSIFNNRVVSSFGEGSITALSLASKVNSLFFTVFATASMQVIYPMLSKLYVQKKYNKLKQTLKEQSSFIISIIVPIAILMILMSKEIIKILFFRGKFSIEDVNITANILSYFSVGLVFYVLRDICNYAYFSMGDSITPSKISIISVFINIINNYLLSLIMGISGVALATSISGIISFILLYVNLNKKLNSVSVIDKKSAFTIIISSIFMVISIILLKENVDADFIGIVVIIIMSGIVYLGVYLLINFKKVKNIIKKEG